MYKYYTVYKTTNEINNKHYIGMHRTNNLDDGYIGSGKALKTAIKKYGKKSFKKEILFSFETEKEMIEKEKELVKIDKDTYNMTIGGMGGFFHINSTNMNHGDNNIMRRSKKVRKKVSDAIKRIKSDPEKKKYYDDISRENLKKALKVNIGRKRPEQSKVMKANSKKLWETRKEEMRDKLSCTYEITSPAGIVTITNRLKEFCVNQKIPPNTIYGSIKERGKIITKGKAKGWKAKLLITAP